ncbi:hypothetical protein L7F22_004591 [Adiantum nelumboides]|nr:hypothetical protein [Adiantum nelumboides]
MSEGDLSKAQLGLGHSYSRSKVKFNVNRSDNMIIQAIALLDVLDKDVNTFSMRVRECLYRNKERLEEEHLDGLAEILDGDETNARNVLDASRASMGTEIGEQDMLNIGHFAERVVQLAEYRKSMSKYLQEKMHLVAPNLSALIGETIGARLISHAGSLTNLAKYPASTVQILGAEKALFEPKDQRKHSQVLHLQVEERLQFYETGKAPGKNSDAMKKAIEAIEEEAGDLMDVDKDDDDEDDDEDETMQMQMLLGLLILLMRKRRVKRKRRRRRRRRKRKERVKE